MKPRAYPCRSFWVNLCKKCVDCGECGDKKYFTAFHRFSYKNSPQNSLYFLQTFSAKIPAFLTKIYRKIHCISYKNFPQKSPHFLQKFTAWWQKIFLWQINVTYAVNAVNAMKKRKSTHFIAFLTNIHRICFPTFT